VPMERLILNYGQVRVQGKLTGRELRDFSIAGVPLVAELAKQLNRAESEIAGMVTAGKIGFPEVEKAFQSMTSGGGRFADLMDKQAKTITGRWSNLKDNMTQFFNLFGQRNEGAINNTLKALSSLVRKMKEMVEIPLADKIAQEQRELNVLILRLQDANIKEDDRKKIIQEIQSKYPDFLKNIKIETASNKELADALNKTNEEYINRIVLARTEAEVQKEINKQDVLKERQDRRRGELLSNMADLLLFINQKQKEGYQVDKQLFDSAIGMQEKLTAVQTIIDDLRSQDVAIYPGTQETLNDLRANIDLLDKEIDKQGQIIELMKIKRDEVKKIEIGK